ncbi:helix-turn-helix domain-containing protein [Burkholderia ubonensis]|uniref:DNA-binding protein n=1 Tax=Burkholderia ubonensis subsp. mesacidophila TaxID=265293 RepID=A0A2A4FDF2_9BURK|nr:XRE family transcriptional regulator [Burkholderia ubonensis]PCE30628.1 DNA-binding protein [Burkholderia ubonensis subsp. mesacidophila]
MDIHTRIARRIRDLRDAQGWSLDALAERSTVSRSNISLIERGQSSPTAVVLDKLATALGVSVASLFESAEDSTSAGLSPHSSLRDQSQWTDPESGYVRRNLSPPAWSPIQLVEVEFPPGKQVAYETAMRDADIHQQIWVIDGAMEVTYGDRQWRLETGDCVTMKLDRPIGYRNTSARPARYLVALCNLSVDEPRSRN